MSLFTPSIPRSGGITSTGIPVSLDVSIGSGVGRTTVVADGLTVIVAILLKLLTAFTKITSGRLGLSVKRRPFNNIMSRGGIDKMVLPLPGRAKASTKSLQNKIKT